MILLISDKIEWNYFIIKVIAKLEEGKLLQIIKLPKKKKKKDWYEINENKY